MYDTLPTFARLSAEQLDTVKCAYRVTASAAIPAPDTSETRDDLRQFARRLVDGILNYECDDEQEPAALWAAGRALAIARHWQPRADR